MSLVESLRLIFNINPTLIDLFLESLTSPNLFFLLKRNSVTKFIKQEKVACTSKRFKGSIKIGFILKVSLKDPRSDISLVRRIYRSKSSTGLMAAFESDK